MHAHVDDATSRLERSDHTAFIENNILYVWGGYQVLSGEDTALPSNKIWLCDLDSGRWECREITGDGPSELLGPCGSYLNGTLYIFAGCDPDGYTNQFFSVDLTDTCYTWKKITDTEGTTPSPRNKHTSWIHRDRLIYFGGYGCKTIQEVRNTSTLSFIVEETSWMAIGTTYFRCWGWNNEVNVFDTLASTWSVPETRGPSPSPRGCHASAVVGNKGYICGGLETKELDLYCLDLDTWTWTYFDLPPCRVPAGRSMHTLTPTSDHTLFLYGGFGANVDKSSAHSDAWQFDTLKNEWTERVNHPHHNKPRLWHTACYSENNEVVVFGGSSNLCVLVDSVAVLRSPWQRHCKDVFVFQIQPYSLIRLCEDVISRNQTAFRHRLSWLPDKLQKKLSKRLAFFSVDQPAVTV